MSEFGLAMIDLDGTLIDTKDDLGSSVNVLRARFGLAPVDLPRVIGWVGDGAPILVCRALEIPEEQARESSDVSDGLAFFREHYVAHMLDHARPYPGVEDGLRRMEEAGMILTVVSNKPGAMSVDMLDRVGLGPRFEMVLGGDALPTRKPDPAPLTHVMERTGVDASRAVMIGDSPQDVLAGKAAGVTTIAALYGFRTREVLTPTNPDHWIERFDDVLPLLGL